MKMRKVLQHRETGWFAHADGQWREQIAHAFDFRSIVDAAQFCATYALTNVQLLHVAANGEHVMSVELCGSNHRQMRIRKSES
jgi:hypothetical protein